MCLKILLFLNFICPTGKGFIEVLLSPYLCLFEVSWGLPVLTLKNDVGLSLICPSEEYRNEVVWCLHQSALGSNWENLVTHSNNLFCANLDFSNR